MSITKRTLFLKASYEGLFTEHELSCLATGESPYLFESAAVDETAQHKIASRQKFPDLEIAFKRPRGKAIQTVIFEVGVTEGYQDLVSDAKQWLLKACHEVNLVVIIDIKEDIRARKRTRESAESKKRIRELVAKYGNGQAQNKHNMDSEDGLEGSETHTISENGERDGTYEQIQSEIDIEDWVGPHTVNLEMWERAGRTAQKRGQTFQVLPRPSYRVRPTIPITDIMPKDEQARMKNFDDSRGLELDMNKFREWLRDARRELALARATNYIRPKERVTDEEFVA
ncbi:hypothetical protein UA08_04305 [Talaromyces atroroseus]|uniref:Uncharacterized protein n=1 Tax=Talaromyces atroroseus TaxID=1441469 RepID=A0A1Q5Q8Y7_TALAT|nr:hypothetical protein UA08_04305 [Talaromyces atroroseus]OKL60532.1 hypothetical protein UA08_04305 [Talaromyces atroroseus]